MKQRTVLLQGRVERNHQQRLQDHCQSNKKIVDKQNAESEVAATQANIESCIVGDGFAVGCGKRIPIIKSACIKPTEGSEDSMPVVTGRVRNKSVSVLRDTGCNGVVIKIDFGH